MNPGDSHISLMEIEETLNEHPAIEEVSVISIPDARLGRALRAVVVLAEGQQATGDELIQWCREELGDEGCPHSIVFTDKLPRNRVGKLSMRDIKNKWGNPLG